MAGIYISRYTGEEIDEALMRALLFNPDENGWIKLSSSETNPVDLGSIISDGNFIVEYFTDGPEDINLTSPINMTVYTIDDIQTQSITLLDIVYYRKYDIETGTYGPWKAKKTTNTIYIDDAPDSPEENSLWITQDENGDYIFMIFQEGEWHLISTPDYMRGAIYDPQKRHTDFFKYVDDWIKKLLEWDFGSMWKDNLPINVVSDFSCVRPDKDGRFVGIVKNSARMMIFHTFETLLTIDLPIIFADGQFTVVPVANDPIRFYVVVYDNGDTLDSLYCSQQLTSWTERPIWRRVSDKILPALEGYEEYKNTAIYGKQTDTLLSDAEYDFGVPFFTRLESEESNIVAVWYIPGIGLTEFFEKGGTDKITATVHPELQDVDDSVLKSIRFTNDIGDTHRWKYRNGLGYSAVESEADPSSFTKYFSGSHQIAHEKSMIGIESVYDVKSTVPETMAGYTKDTLTAEFYGYFLSVSIQNETTEFHTRKEVDSSYLVLSNLLPDSEGKYVGFGLRANKTFDQITVDTNQSSVEIEPLSELDPARTYWEMYYTGDLVSIFYTLITEAVSEANITTTYRERDFLTAVKDHIEDEGIHFTDEDRHTLYTRETKENVEVKFNRVEATVKKYSDEATQKAIEDGLALLKAFEDLEEEYRAHIANDDIHPTVEEQEYWDAKAEPDHTHNVDGRVKIYAHQVVGGKFDLARIPEGAKELLTKVQSMEERNQLTIDQVQNGDRVAIYAEGIWEVVDETKLAYYDEEGNLVPAQDEAFYECSAGSGVYIEWKNVEHTPNTLFGYGIEDTYTREEFDALLKRLIEEETAKLEERYGEFDLEALFRLVHKTHDDINTVKDEIEDAIALTLDVRQLEIMVKEQNRRMVTMSEDLTEAQVIVTNLLSLYS